MQIYINEQTCTGCNLCVFGCPEQAISCYAVANLDSIRCNGCLKCIHFCPVDAIEVREEE